MAKEKRYIDETEINAFLAAFGIIMPRNEEELNQILDEEPTETSELLDFHIDALKLIDESKATGHDDSNKKLISTTKQTGNYFKRIVLAAEITSQLCEEPTFGHVKFQKMIYLCENVVGLDFNFRYSKQAAGPYDRKLMHSIDQQFQRQGWFSVVVEKSKYSKITYSPGEKFNSHKPYFNKYYKSDIGSIQAVIDLFRTSKTREVELIATMFYCWTELKEKGQLINAESLQESVYAWSEEKAKYSKGEIASAFDWMCESSFHP